MGQVHASGQLGRAELARSTGLSTQAVSNIIADLEADGLLLERGRVSNGRGLPAVQYGLNPKGGYAFGAEIRPDAVFAALLDLDGTRLFEGRAPLPRATPEAAATCVTRLFHSAMETADIPPSRILGAGIVMPGPFGTGGTRNNRAELQDWHQVDATALFSDALCVPVQIENDANAAALAERISGAARNLESFAYLYFGAGLGLGIVTHGRLMKGAFGNAGEIGAIEVPGPAGGIVLEDVVSRIAVQTHLANAGITAQSGDDLARLYAAKTPALMDWLAQATAPLTHAISIVENLFDPEAIILGGAMPDALLDHLIATVTPTGQSVSNRTDRAAPRLMRGASGRMTATLGAAALVLHQTFTPHIAVAS